MSCYNLTDGRLVWLTFLSALSRTPNGYLFNLPLLVDGVIVVQAASHVLGLDAATGKVLWDHPYPTRSIRAARRWCSTRAG